MTHDDHRPAEKQKLSRRRFLKAGAAAGIGLAGVGLTGCIGDSKVVINGTETRTYQGVQLSSIQDFKYQTLDGTPHLEAGTYALAINGLVSVPQTLSYDDVLRFSPHKKVIRLSCVEGWDATALWEGVLLSDLLEAARPLPAAVSVIFHAADGDSSSLDLAFVRDHSPLLAYKINDVTLPGERGYPFRVVAEGKWGYKWAKWVTRIELSESRGTGYWEARGYSGNGDLNQSFLS